MKTTKIITILLLAFYTVKTSANLNKIKGNGNKITTERTIGSYDKIASSGSFDIILTSGTEGELSIDIEENLSAYLITEVKNNELKIHWKKGSNISQTKSVQITVPIVDLYAISQSGSGSVNSKTTVKGSDLTLSMSGSGTMNLDVKSTNIKSYLSGSGKINLDGTTDIFECSISGSGNIGGYDLVVSESTDAKISGSGNIKATVNGELNARISGSGHFRYQGKPTKEIIKVSGSGNVSSN